MASIPSYKLRISDLPKENADWKKITTFASTFDIAAECPEGAQITGVRDVSESSGIIDLRLALYVEWRRYNHYHEQPDAATLRQLQEILGWIRQRLQLAE